MRNAKSEMLHISEPLRRLAVDIDTLRPDPHNARRHDERNLDAIAASLRRFGQQAPVVYVQKGPGKGDRGPGKKIVIKGNGVLAAARRLGWKVIAAVRSDLAGREAQGLAIADNRTTDLSEFDEQLLAKQLKELQEADFEMEAVGFTEAEFQDALKELDADASGGGEQSPAPRTRGERVSAFLAGHLKFEVPRAVFDRWISSLEGKVGNDPDRLVAEIKRRLKLGAE